MTYAYAQSRRIDPAGLVAAIAINAAVVAALLTAAPHVLPKTLTSLATYTPAIAPPPEPLPPPEPVERRAELPPRPADSRIVAPRPEVPVPADGFTGVELGPFVPDLRFDRTGTGTGTTAGTADAADPPAPPPLVAATPDPRFLDRLQPPYPPAKQRNEEEGSVRVRFLIGTDGRVRAIEPVGAVDDAFYAATRRQALSAWRFRPATRGGQAVENWQVLTIRFVLQR